MLQAYTSVLDNFVHDTTARALYIGGSRYCTKPTGFATDGGINTNQWVSNGKRTKEIGLFSLSISNNVNWVIETDPF